MTESTPEILKQIELQELLLLDKQREAVDLILSNNLQHHFQAVRTAQSILMPFWLKTGNTDKVVQYLKHQSTHLSAFVRELDQCMAERSQHLSNILKTVFPNLPENEKQKQCRLKQKSLRKLLILLIREFDLRSESHPILQSSLQLMTVNNRVRLYATPQPQDSSATKRLKFVQFAQYMQYAYQNQPESYPIICHQLRRHNIIKFIGLLLVANVPQRDWPDRVKCLADLPELITMANKSERKQNQLHSQNSPVDCLKLPSHIKPELIDSPHQLKEAMKYLLTQTVIGLDVETNSVGKPELLQMASAERVFVFDQPKLEANCPQIWYKKLYKIYKSERITKLGFDMQGDMGSIQTYLGRGLNMPFKDVHFRNGFCMRGLVKFELPVDGSKQSSGLPWKERTSLTKMCERYLDVGLDKREQQSCWAARPLRQSQLYYAALDAHCLLRLYEFVNVTPTSYCAFMNL